MFGQGWIGCDFDGTLAVAPSPYDPTAVGAPIPKMVERVKSWLAEGKDVRILTARVAYVSPELLVKIEAAIQKFCLDNLGKVLPVTCIKDHDMLELWDDRARQVELNTGVLIRSIPDSSLTSGTDRAMEFLRVIKQYTEAFGDPDNWPVDSRENMFEMLRSSLRDVVQKPFWSRLGIGYSNVSGQSFPEACALEAPHSLGPQGEPIYAEQGGVKRCVACICGGCEEHRYSEDQPREPNGEFGSGGAATEAKTSENKEEHIASVIKDQVHKMVGDKDPSLINNGNCIVFAKKMEEQIPGAVRVGIPNVALYGKDREHTIAGDAGKPRVTVSIDRPVKADDMPSRIHSYLHQWVQVDGKNYDSETPNGVKNWKDLPYFKKGGAGRENLDIALASMLSKKDRSLANEQQGEPVYRYSEDQPRDPNGEFASGGGASEDAWLKDMPKDSKEYVGESKAPDGTEGKFSAENGGTLFHGTGHTLPNGKFKAGETYTAVEWNETHAFAKGEVPGAGGGPKPWVVQVEAKPGKTLDVNKQFSDMIENGDPFTDEPKIFSAARAAGARYVTFDHPSSVKDGEFKAIVSLYPHEDLKSKGGYALSKRSLDETGELRYSEDQPRTPDGEFGSGGAAVTVSPDIMDHYKDAAGHNVEVWHSERSAVRQPQGEPLYAEQGGVKRCVACICGGCEEHRYSDDQPRDADGKFGSGGDVYTLAGAKELVGKLGDGVTIIGSVATKGESKHDLDLLASSKETAEAARVKLEGLGYEWMGNSTLSPKEAAAYKGPKTFEKGKWSVMDEYTHTDTGKHVEVWHTEAADEERSLRYNPDQPRDSDGEFAGGEASGASAQSPEFEKQETKIEGDVKTTKYVSPNHSIIVEHNTKEGKVTVKHLDKNGDLLVQQTHDSIGAARKELQTQGIDHKFYAARSFGIQGEPFD